MVIFDSVTGVVTVDNNTPSAAALAVIGDRIAEVGSAAAIAAYIGDDTEVVDLAGKTAIPGFIEGHGHYTSFGGSLTILDFRYANSFAEIVSMVEGAASETPAGEWIIGRGSRPDFVTDGSFNIGYVGCHICENQQLLRIDLALSHIVAVQVYDEGFRDFGTGLLGSDFLKCSILNLIVRGPIFHAG